MLGGLNLTELIIGLLYLVVEMWAKMWAKIGNILINSDGGLMKFLKNYNFWYVFFVALGSIGSILVAIIAIWGEWIRSMFLGPQLSLVPHNFRGNVTTATETDIRTGSIIRKYTVIYYHLRVENSRRWAVAKNCRVLLREVYKREPNGEFRRLPLVVPLHYVWSPAEWSPALKSVSDNEVLDFGSISEISNRFNPKFYVTSANFEGYVKANEVIRYGLSIVADNFVSPNLQIFEVGWNGKFSENLDEMSRNLNIKEVTDMNK